jgi:hypothetical protein
MLGRMPARGRETNGIYRSRCSGVEIMPLSHRFLPRRLGTDRLNRQVIFYESAIVDHSPLLIELGQSASQPILVERIFLKLPLDPIEDLVEELFLSDQSRQLLLLDFRFVVDG